MFRTAKHTFAAAVVIVTAAAPSTAFADTPPSSGSGPAISEIVVTKSVDASSPKLYQTAATGTILRAP
jgi:type VI protein secretion system component Hcp